MTRDDLRGCLFCGHSLRRRRSHARYCGNACRADASRLRRLLDGDHIDGYASVAAFIATRYRFSKPTQAPSNASDRRDRAEGSSGSEQDSGW